MGLVILFMKPYTYRESDGSNEFDWWLLRTFGVLSLRSMYAMYEVCGPEKKKMNST